MAVSRRARAARRRKRARRKSEEATRSLTETLERVAVWGAPWMRWTGAVTAWAVAVFLLAALASFSPADPDWDHAVAVRTIHNLGGLVGAYLAGTTVRALGVVAFVVPVVLLLVGVDLVRRPERRTPLGLRLVWTLWLLLALAAAGGLLWPELTWRGLPAVGWIGRALGLELVRPYLGIAGLALLVPGILAGVVGVVGLEALRAMARGAVGLAGLTQRAGTAVAVRLRARWRHLRLRRQRSRREGESEVTPAPVEAPRGGRRRPRLQVVAGEPTAPEPDPAQRRSLSDEETLPELAIAPPPKEPRRAPVAVQRTLVTPDEGYRTPDLDLLAPAPPPVNGEDERVLRAKAQLLEHKLREYGVEGRVTAVRPGPVISIYEFQPAPGVKVSRIANLGDDLALATESLSVRIVAPIPGRNVVGIEIPNKRTDLVALRSVLESQEFWRKSWRLPVGLGKDTAGRPVVADLASMPHLLIAGATGSGKSVGINTLIVSLLYRHTPETLRLYLIDPKRLELSFYQGIPHLEGHDVVTDPHAALALLEALVREMEDRYGWMEHARVRNLASFNKAVAAGRVSPLADQEPRPFPYVVCVIDELADLMMVTRRAIEHPIARLAQMARAAGIHLVVATQRPSVDVLTGTIKANFPTRIAFKVSSKADARVILDQIGAESLLGKGDMLFKPPDSDIPVRVHGAFVSEEEVERVAAHWRTEAERVGVPRPVVGRERLDAALDAVRRGGGGEVGGGEEDGDPLFERAVELGRAEGVISTSRIQRALGIGYNRAAKIMDALEARGFVGPPEGAGKPRKFLGPPDDGDGDEER